MHAISIGSIAVDVHDHLVVKGLNDAVTRVWNFLFVEEPACGLVGIAPEEVNLVVNDLLEKTLSSVWTLFILLVAQTLLM